MRSPVLVNIMRVGRCFHAYRRRALKDTLLHPSQHLLLSRVCRQPGLRQEELAGELFLDKTTVARQLIRMEELGFISRGPDPEDGRCRRIYPTALGEELYPRVHGAFEEFTRGLLEGFSAQELGQLEALTGRLLRNAEAMAPAERGQED